MIPHRFRFHTFSLLMSLLMSGVMSLAMLAINSATFIDVLSQWPGAWAIT
jgi:hypothetical protein